MVSEFTVKLQESEKVTPRRKSRHCFLFPSGLMSRQTDRLMANITRCRCAKLVVCPCHQINEREGSNPIFGLGIVKDKKRDQCHGFHSVTPGWRSKKGDRSLERSSHLVRGDRGGGDKKSRCSLYSTVQPSPTHPLKVFNLFLTAWFLGLLPLLFLQRGQKGCRCTSAPPL